MFTQMSWRSCPGTVSASTTSVAAPAGLCGGTRAAGRTADDMKPRDPEEFLYVWDDFFTLQKKVFGIYAAGVADAARRMIGISRSVLVS